MTAFAVSSAPARRWVIRRAGERAGEVWAPDAETAQIRASFRYDNARAGLVPVTVEPYVAAPSVVPRWEQIRAVHAGKTEKVGRINRENRRSRRKVR